MTKLFVYGKAVVATAVVVAGMIAFAAIDKNISFDEATAIWTAIVAGLTGVAVARTRNRPAA
jgi:hypothetical protein